MMHPRRSAHVLTVAILTSALCADRIAAAMPMTATQEVGSFAEQLLDRLTIGFRRVVTAIRFCQARLTHHSYRTMRHPAVLPQVAAVHQLTPFQFRLPPPAIGSIV
jgi:hypothetical protein